MPRSTLAFRWIGSLLAVSILGALAAAAEGPPVLRFNGQGKFRIVQFTDTHWNDKLAERPKTLEVLNRVLDEEKPDLVVLTGDIVTLDRQPQEGWKRVLEPILRRGIPWAVVLGNHDDESHGVPRRELVRFLASLPHGLTQEGPELLGATGNYILPVVGAASGKPEATLYFLDSRAYPKSQLIRDRCKDKDVAASYGWISFDQIQWYRQSSREIREANGGRTLPALAFFHIPLPEYAHPLRETLLGTRKEDVCCGALNTGLFAALHEEGDVLGVFVGHDHDNDDVADLFGIGLAYGRCSGFGAYGNLPRGARVIELAEGKREFESWVRSEGQATERFRFPAAAE